MLHCLLLDSLSYHVTWFWILTTSRKDRLSISYMRFIVLAFATCASDSLSSHSHKLHLWLSCWWKLFLHWDFGTVSKILQILSKRKQFFSTVVQPLPALDASVWVAGNNNYLAFSSNLCANSWMQSNCWSFLIWNSPTLCGGRTGSWCRSTVQSVALSRRSSSSSWNKICFNPSIDCDSFLFSELFVWREIQTSSKWVEWFRVG